MHFQFLDSISRRRNEVGSKLQSDVAMSPPLSLFCREETRDGDTYEFYAPDSYRSTATYAIVFRKDAQVQRLAAHRFGSAHEYRITIARRTTRRDASDSTLRAPNSCCRLHCSPSFSLSVSHLPLSLSHSLTAAISVATPGQTRRGPGMFSL